MDVQGHTNTPEYFTQDMQKEFHVALAKREATKILRRVDYHKTASLLEKHVDLKYSKQPTQVVGS